MSFQLLKNLGNLYYKIISIYKFFNHETSMYKDLCTQGNDYYGWTMWQMKNIKYRHMKEVIILFLSISIFTSIDMVAQSKKELRKKEKKHT